MTSDYIAPEERFSDRGDYYARCRPGYPEAVVCILQEECGLQPDWCIADIGSGTGLLARLLLEHGYCVHAVEPNAAMREQALKLLSHYPRFTSLLAKAEETGLPDHSVHMITVAQAIHWFEPEATRREFARILKPGGWLAVIRNWTDFEDPLIKATREVVEAYRNAPREGEGRWQWDDALAARYYGPGGWRVRTCRNEQVLDEEGYLGRWLSQSTVPLPGQCGHDEMCAKLRRIFAEYQRDGVVTLPYETQLHIGHIADKEH